jgi:pilus assembly protein CpaF
MEEQSFLNEGVAALLADPGITEVLVNGPGEIWAERNGSLERTSLSFPSDETLRRWVRGFLSERGRKVDHASPFADCSLPDGSRVHVVAPPVSRKGLCLSIRKFPEMPWSLAALQEQGAFNAECGAYLKKAVNDHRNVFLSGSTGSGKTSLLGALLAEVSPHERIVALEDIAEIRTHHPHFLAMEGRPANQEGEGRIELRRLLREALRMRPDRIVVGECRGPEALDLLLALNSGHHGSLGTIHANSPRDALQRLETLALLAGENLGTQALQNLILGGVNIVVQLGRVNGKRGVVSVAEVKGIDGGRFLLKELTF